MKKKITVLGKKANFLGIDEGSGWEESRVVVLPAPLEKTSSYMKGTARGPASLLAASRQVEFYDDELRDETFRKGIATLPALNFTNLSLEASVRKIENGIAGILKAGKKPLLIGGEHTVTVGAVRACCQSYPDLSVLHLDAHTDLRDSYEGSPYNHACVMARVMEICPFVSVGIRSLSVEEGDWIQTKMLPVYDIHSMRADQNWPDKTIAQLSGSVYVTLDLDALDPSIMPAVGTPEPGGMGWRECLGFLKKVFQRKHVVGFDVNELCPRPGTEYGVFSAAKLTYRCIGYWLQNAIPFNSHP